MIHKSYISKSAQCGTKDLGNIKPIPTRPRPRFLLTSAAHFLETLLESKLAQDQTSTRNRRAQE